MTSPEPGIRIFAIAAIAVIAMLLCGDSTVEAQNREKPGMIHTIPGRGANVYLINGGAGWILVDTGMKGSAEGLVKAFGGLGIDPRTIHLIIITHAHPDHYGELARLKRLTGAKVVAHRYESYYIETGRSSPIVAQTAKGRLINAVSPRWKLQSAKVEIIVDDELNLSAFGAGGKVVSTPGHTRGSLSIVLDDGTVLVGDQFRGASGRLTLGMFYEDRRTLAASLKQIARYHPKILHMSHGASTDLADLEALIGTLEE